MWRSKLSALAFLAMGIVAGLGLSVSLDWVGRLRAAPKMTDEEVNKELAALQRQSDAIAALAARVKPSVVTIYATKIVRLSESPDFEPFRFFFGDEGGQREFRRQGQGSGFIVQVEGDTGIILTNAHVASGQDELKVKLWDDREFDAKIRGTDPKTDIAVIEIHAAGLKALPIGNSAEVEPGQMVMAIGSPFGLDETLTVGYISAKGRHGFRAGTYENYLQTDAAINPGNSGGPLINLQGQAIGINTMILTRSGTFSGIGLAIPINMAKTIMEELLAKGKITRAWLGIQFAALSPEIMTALKVDHGVQVSKVLPGDPAEKAGIKSGDILLSFGKEKITDSEKFRYLVAETKVGSTVPITLFRGAKEMTVSVTLTEQPEDLTAAGEQENVTRKLGMTVQELTDEVAQHLGYQGQKGVVVTEVDPRGPAASASPTPIQVGDLIQEIARQSVASLADYSKALAKVDLGKGVLMHVRSRDGATRYVVIKETKEQKKEQ